MLNNGADINTVKELRTYILAATQVYTHIVCAVAKIFIKSSSKSTKKKNYGNKMQAINFIASDKLRLCGKKVSKVEKLFDQLSDRSVFKSRSRNVVNKRFIKMAAPNVEFFASKTAEHLNKLLMNVLKLERQILKQKIKITD